MRRPITGLKVSLAVYLDMIIWAIVLAEKLPASEYAFSSYIGISVCCGMRCAPRDGYFPRPSESWRTVSAL
ncbi:hypothetical protein BDV98DRAFT_568191 [Pterulicium gracile]|uniref:Uncharacterized protein n=1 Tax=Pterulicium gracile TaxID=1884261 RepID=A0A5C3QFU3_9AGAR|nr:hypothetical protein BDV98DRAFT_568191 [Pterula gracilis]